MFQIPSPSHMPFETRDPSGRVLTLLCLPSGTTPTGAVLWKAHYMLDGAPPVRLELQQPADAMECSPTAWHDGTHWRVSFISGAHSKCVRFFLYEACGPRLNALGTPRRAHWTRAGFVCGDRIARLATPELVEVYGNHARTSLRLPGVQVYRVSYRADDPDTLLITAREKNAAPFTLTFNLPTWQERTVTLSDGGGVYKCSLYGDRIIYASGEVSDHDRRLTCDTFVTRRTNRIQVAYEDLPQS